MFGHVMFAPERTPEEVVRVSNSVINWQLAMIVILVLLLVLYFLYAHNAFSGYFMAMLWGGLGCYLYHQCFAVIVNLLRSFGLAAFINVAADDTVTMHPAAPFISLIFVFLEAVVLVAWLFAFYKFFILLKQKPTMGSTVNVALGYTFIEFLLIIVNFGLSILTAKSINNMENYAALTAKMDENGIKELERYLEDVSRYTTPYCIELIIGFISTIFFVMALVIFIHCYMSKKEAKPCFATAVMYTGSYLLWDNTLFADNMGIVSEILKLIIAIIGLVFALKFLKEHCPEHHALFTDKFKKGPFYLFFHYTPTDKPGMPGNGKDTGSKIASKATKRTKVGNFKDFHSLDKK
ncbi:MAG: hypothetical protein IKX10_09365 [Lachnospiraceae bacterium]|nr:hypothetical protein [Lachnospiraceae bacterium]